MIIYICMYMYVTSHVCVSCMYIKQAGLAAGCATGSSNARPITLCLYIYIYIPTYIHIYIERERVMHRERER